MTNNLFTPLQIVKGEGLKRNADIKAAIDFSISTLLNTPKGTVACDPNYGFTFQNFRFEMFNENDGVIFNPDNDQNPLYKKKISGTSKNIQTFAADLNESVKKYEPRLSEPSSTMTYVRQTREVLVVVKGTIAETKKPYTFTTTLKLWTK